MNLQLPPITIGWIIAVVVIIIGLLWLLGVTFSMDAMKLTMVLIVALAVARLT